MIAGIIGRNTKKGRSAVLSFGSALSLAVHALARRTPRGRIEITRALFHRHFSFLPE
jgi:hypothetical protein